MNAEQQEFVESFEFSHKWGEYRPNVHYYVPCSIEPVGNKFRPMVDFIQCGEMSDTLEDAALQIVQRIDELREIAYQNQPEAVVSFTL